MYLRLVKDFFLSSSDFPSQVLGLKFVLPAQTRIWSLGNHRNEYIYYPCGLVQSLHTVFRSILVSSGTLRNSCFSVFLNSPDQQ